VLISFLIAAVMLIESGAVIYAVYKMIKSGNLVLLNYIIM